MIGALKRYWQGIRGTGDAALTVPPMDGAFLPNSKLDEAAVLHAVAAPDNLAVLDGALCFSSGSAVLRMAPGQTPMQIADGDAEVTAICAIPGKGLVVARSGGVLTLLNADGQETPVLAGGATTPGDVSAVALLPDGRLAYAIGAHGTKAADWARDFLLRGASGSVWRAEIGGKPEQLAGRLRYPLGLIAAPDNSLIVSMSWSSALERIGPDGKCTAVLRNLPGYPARIVNASDGGYWLSFFAPRNQMLEFVLREPQYLSMMMQEIEPAHWLAPRLSADIGPTDPMLEGCTKHGAEIKP